ncbi:MAG: class I SAM-dependent methyltransferase [Pseudobdellovibrionaceae bacterium]
MEEQAKFFENSKILSPEISKEVLDKGALAFGVLRTGLYLIEGLSLPIVHFLATGKKRARPRNRDLMLRRSLQELFKLLKRDSENISNGIYPVSVLKPEWPRQHLLRLPRIWWDGFFLAKRRTRNEAHQFGGEAQEFLRDLPDYYKRNFHYQSEGYLSKKSADLYEHQVEILFAGAADAMRRLLLPHLKAKFKHTNGEGLRFLEIGSGTGTLTRSVRLTFPKAKIVCLDLSHPYLKKAQEYLQKYNRIDFIQGDAAEMPFAAEKFDAVISCFLFHELPLDIRKKVIAESMRVLKPGGFFGLVDSVQKDDVKDFEWALNQFPVDFHEPFYKNYTMNSMEGLLKAAGLQNICSEVGFYSKVCAAEKSEI